LPFGIAHKDDGKNVKGDYAKNREAKRKVRTGVSQWEGSPRRKNRERTG